MGKGETVSVPGNSVRAGSGRGGALKTAHKTLKNAHKTGLVFDDDPRLAHLHI